MNATEYKHNSSLTQQLQGEDNRAFSYSQRPSHWASGPGCVLDWVCYETQRGSASQTCSPRAELDSVSFSGRHWLSPSHFSDCYFCDCQKLHVLFQEVLQENSEKEEGVDILINVVVVVVVFDCLETCLICVFITWMPPWPGLLTWIKPHRTCWVCQVNICYV